VFNEPAKKLNFTQVQIPMFISALSVHII